MADNEQAVPTEETTVEQSTEESQQTPNGEEAKVEEVNEESEKQEETTEQPKESATTDAAKNKQEEDDDDDDDDDDDEEDDEDDEEDDEDDEDENGDNEGGEEKPKKKKRNLSKKQRRAAEEQIEHVEDERPHINVVFIGHVDAGKSTLSGNMLYLTGMVDKRTIEKYERDAKDKNRESWFLAYIMDTNEEERAKGKTVEVGRAHFETDKKRYTILDAPGHKNYVPNMIGGAAQADLGILVISARKGEFETGFDRGGQTREHTTLARTLGVQKLIVAINKMDEETVQWAKARYDFIIKKLRPFLRGLGYGKKDVTFIPVSGYKGSNIKDKVTPEECDWYKGETLMTLLDDMPNLHEENEEVMRIPILDKYRDRGTCVAMGKIESGVLVKGQKVIIMPNKTKAEISFIDLDTKEVTRARAGENVNVGLSGVSTKDIKRGFVLCDLEHPIRYVSVFKCELVILDLLPHKSVFTAGYSAVMHLHTAEEEVEVKRLLAWKKNIKKAATKQSTDRRPRFGKEGDVLHCTLTSKNPICMHLFEDIAKLGRFTLRDEGKTIAVGTIIALPEMSKSESMGV